MVNPSGIRHSQNDELQVNEVRQGLYAVQNAYVGVYEYFKNRPIATEQKNQEKPVDEDERGS